MISKKLNLSEVPVSAIQTYLDMLALDVFTPEFLQKHIEERKAAMLKQGVFIPYTERVRPEGILNECVITRFWKDASGNVTSGTGKVHNGLSWNYSMIGYIIHLDEFQTSAYLKARDSK